MTESNDTDTSNYLGGQEMQYGGRRMVPNSWTCGFCGASDGPERFLHEHLKEEHGWVNGEGFTNGRPDREITDSDE